MQMSYLRKIEYEIVLKDSFWVIRSCPKCGRKTHYRNTNKFRINANGNKLDVWLIYHCTECKHTLNIAIYERKKVSSIPKKNINVFWKKYPGSNTCGEYCAPPKNPAALH